MSVKKGDTFDRWLQGYVRQEARVLDVGKRKGKDVVVVLRTDSKPGRGSKRDGRGSVVVIEKERMEADIKLLEAEKRAYKEELEAATKKKAKKKK